MLKILPKAGSISAQIMLLRCYVEVYGLSNTRDPLFPVTFNDSEDHLADSLLERVMIAFAENGIGERWNVSWNDFLDLPAYMCDMMMEQSSILNKKEAERTKRVMRDVQTQ